MPTGVGQPPAYKPEYCEQLIEHMKEGLSYSSFAANVGVHIDTLYSWEKKFPEWKQAKMVGRAHLAKFYEQVGRSAMLGKIKNFNPSTYIWLTKVMLGWKDTDNITTKNEIHVNQLSAAPLEISNEELAKRIASYYIHKGQGSAALPKPEEIIDVGTAKN